MFALQRGNAAKTGAIVGALILGTLGTALGAWAGAESTDHDFQTGEGCFSAKRMDSWGAQYSGASPVSPYLSCTRAGVVCTHDDREYLYLVAKRHPTKHLI